MSRRQGPAQISPPDRNFKAATNRAAALLLFRRICGWKMNHGGAGGLFLASHRAFRYQALDLGQRTGSAPTQMLQRRVARSALQPSSGADVRSRRGRGSRPSARRMSSLLTSADSKASLIQQRQQRISACKPSPWRLTQLYPPPPSRYVANVTSRSISPAPLFGVRGTAGPPLREPEGREEARGGGVELFQAACILLPFDHYIIAAHAAPAVHS